MKKFVSLFIKKDITKEEKGLFYQEIKKTGFIIGMFVFLLFIFYSLGLLNGEFSGDRYFKGKYKDYIFIALTIFFILVLIAVRIFFTIKRHKMENRKTKI